MNTNQAKAINHILEYLHDSHEGFKKSAENITDNSLQHLLLTLSSQRETMIHDLEKALEQQGEAPTKRGSMVAALHRTFLSLKSSLTGGDSKAIVEEIKRGETVMLSCYKDVLNDNLPAYLQALLHQQASVIEANLNRVEAAAYS